MMLCKKCGNKFPSRIKLNGKWVTLDKRSFCLKCSPFGCHNTRNLAKIPGKEPKNSKYCPRCEKVKNKNQFHRAASRLLKNNPKALHTYCKKCCSEESKTRKQNYKRKYVEMLGGKCTNCSYDKCISALEFHHKDRSKKEFTIGNKRGISEKLALKELKKCKLLCSNCHREAHWELSNPPVA